MAGIVLSGTSTRREFGLSALKFCTILAITPVIASCGLRHKADNDAAKPKKSEEEEDQVKQVKEPWPEEFSDRETAQKSCPSCYTVRPALSDDKKTIRRNKEGKPLIEGLSYSYTPKGQDKPVIRETVFDRAITIEELRDPKSYSNVAVFNDRGDARKFFRDMEKLGQEFEKRNRENQYKNDLATLQEYRIEAEIAKKDLAEISGFTPTRSKAAAPTRKIKLRPEN